MVPVNFLVAPLADMAFDTGKVEGGVNCKMTKFIDKMLAVYEESTYYPNNNLINYSVKVKKRLIVVSFTKI